MAIDENITDVVQDASVPLTTYEYHGFDDIETTLPGPEINGRSTKITLLSPSRFRQSGFLESTKNVANEGFRSAHIRTGVLPGEIDRIRSQQYLIDEIGSVPGTFTYIIHEDNTNIIATATMRPFRIAATEAVPGMSSEDLERIRRQKVFYRLEALPPNVQGWELKVMVVSSAAQGQGLAGKLIDLCEVEARRRSQTVSSKTKEVRFVLTCIAEINEKFYMKKGFSEDYRTAIPVGTMGSETGFNILHMSKSISTR